MTAFEDVGDTPLWIAVRATAREEGRTFFPTPGEIRTHLTNRRPDPPLTLADPDDAITKWYAEHEATSRRVKPNEASA